MNGFILEDSYKTSPNHKRVLLDKLALGTNLYFGPRFIQELLSNRKMALAGNYSTKQWADKSLDILRVLEDCGGKFVIEGMDNVNLIPSPVIFISNHMSMLESFVLPGIIASRREVSFVVKSSLTTHKLFGPIMRARNPIAVDRKDPIADFKKVMEEGTKYIESGISIIIFPQSQRMVDFNPALFNSLGVKLAKKTNTPIIPLALKTDFWQNGKYVKDFGNLNRKEKIHFKFGKPIIVDGNGKKEHEQVLSFISEALAEWNQNQE